MNTNQEVVGVVGAGVIGLGLAQCLAAAGYRVVITDRAEAARSLVESGVRDGLRLSRLLAGAASARPATADVLGRLVVTGGYAAFAEAHFVFEAVRERPGEKEQVLRALEGACGADAVFASTTSAIPIARLGQALAHPERLLGLHVMNPVPLRPSVELIRGPRTADATVERATRLLGRLDKTWIEVKDGPGFVANRVLMRTVVEAAHLVAEERAAPETVDRIFRECLGHKMGPLETADLIGIDVVLDTLAVLEEELGGAGKYQPPALLAALVADGRLGRKSGHGFYRYPAPGDPG